MEQTTLQKRIEERAKAKLLKDLFDAANQEASIASMFNIFDSNLWDKKLNVTEYYDNYSNPKTQIRLRNEYSQKVFDTLLPKYITDITDDILQKIDEIDNLLVSNRNGNDY